MYQYVKQHCNHDFKNRITIANVEFDCSTEKISSMEFSMERPKINGKACVYRGFRKNKKKFHRLLNGTPMELSMELLIYYQCFKWSQIQLQKLLSLL